MKQCQNGFTLLELLIVIGVISIIAAIIVPVFVKSKSRARQAVSISNLRQCGLALSMYSEDYGGNDMLPTGDAALKLLTQNLTCDPNDTWRQNCSTEVGLPLIGSYGYIRAVSDFSTEQAWRDYLAVDPNPTLMASIFYADHVPLLFKGDSATYSARCGIRGENCSMPDRVLRLRLDGSVASIGHGTDNPNVTLLCSWQAIFTGHPG